MVDHLSIRSETGRLKKVVIGYAENFHLVPPEAVNETQKKFYFGSDHPDREIIVEEYKRFKQCLESRQVEVLQPVPVPEVPDQISPRDIGFVVNETFVVARMAKQSREEEWQGLSELFARLPAESVIRAPADSRIEGGDVIVDRGRIHVGIGQRTTAAGAKFVADSFPERETVVAELSALSDGEDVIHLDCVFVPVGHESALIYRPGFKEVPECILREYDLIDITRAEQQSLAANVLSLSPTAVISMSTFSRINDELSRRGIEILEVDFTETCKTGGSFHCGSLPIARDS